MARVTTITEGPIFSTVLKLAWPVVASMLLEFALSITDYFWVGYLGTPEQDALTSAMVVTWTIFAVSGIIVTGLTALVSRMFGANDPEMASYYAKQGIFLALGLGVGLSVAGILFTPTILEFMEAAPNVVALGTIYLRTFFAGMIFFMINEAMASIFRATGDTRSPMIAFSSGVILNIILDPVLIFGWGPFPEMGVGGAAAATIISIAVTFLIFLFMVLRGSLDISLKKWYREKPNFSALGKIFNIGLPISTQDIVFIVVYWFLIQVVHHFGTEAGAAMGIGNRMESLSFLVSFGISTAAATVVGQNLGAKQPGRAERGAWATVGIVSIWTLFSTIFFVFIPGPIAKVFSSDPVVVEIAIDYLIILGLSQIFMGIEIVLQGAFSGAGNTVPPMIVSIPGSIARLPLAYWLCFGLDLGINGVWWTLTITSFVKAVILVIWFKKGSWKKKKL